MLNEEHKTYAPVIYMLVTISFSS